MMEPRYREILADQVPKFRGKNGVVVKVIRGRIGDARGPVRDIVINPEYLDISIPAGADYNHPTMAGRTVFAYVIGGMVEFADGTGPGNKEKHLCDNETLVLFADGDLVSARAPERDARFLLISGNPIHEPVAWRGPIVMNTEKELRLAFKEYQNHTFIKIKG